MILFIFVQLLLFSQKAQCLLTKALAEFDWLRMYRQCGHFWPIGSCPRKVAGRGRPRRSSRSVRIRMQDAPLAKNGDTSPTSNSSLSCIRTGCRYSGQSECFNFFSLRVRRFWKVRPLSAVPLTKLMRVGTAVNGVSSVLRHKPVLQSLDVIELHVLDY